VTTLNKQDHLKALEDRARNIRIHIINMLAESGSGHPGGSLSGADILAALYFDVMNIDEHRLGDTKRDKFVLSKGHAAPLLYATLAEKGCMNKECLLSLRKVDSKLQGHPDMKKVPGVEMSTGSLGQGLAVANGMALAARLDGLDNHIYVLMGDGELQEGMVWEAAMASAHYKLDHVTAIVDFNGLQIDGFTKDVMNVNPIVDKFKAFGWETLEMDGHNMEEILATFAKAKEIKGKPTVIVAKTIKGKGVSFMENQAGWHGTAPKPEEAAKAIAELKGGK
jgi:transketolase